MEITKENLNTHKKLFKTQIILRAKSIHFENVFCSIFKLKTIFLQQKLKTCEIKQLLEKLQSKMVDHLFTFRELETIFEQKVPLVITHHFPI